MDRAPSSYPHLEQLCHRILRFLLCTADTTAAFSLPFFTSCLCPVATDPTQISNNFAVEIQIMPAAVCVHEEIQIIPAAVCVHNEASNSYQIHIKFISNSYQIHIKLISNSNPDMAAHSSTALSDCTWENLKNRV